MAARGKERKCLPFDPRLVHTEDVLESVPEGARFGAVIVDLKKERDEVEIKNTYPDMYDEQQWATFGGQLAFEVSEAAHHDRDDETYPNPNFEELSKERYTDWMNPVYINRYFIC